MRIKLPGGNSVAVVESVWGESDDVQFDAYYEESGDPILEVDHEFIQDNYQAELYEYWYQQKVMEAEYSFDENR